MRKILIVHAHQEPKSFCSALKNTAAEFFISNGDHVDVIDLYAVEFDPVGGKNDFKSSSESDYFKYQREQVHAFENGLFKDSLQKHMELFEACDVLIFNFPLWWFDLPAILKGWVDRVFAMGFAYGNGKGVYENGVFKNKTAFCCMTTGGPQKAYGTGKNGELEKILYPINHGIFYFVGMRVLSPFIGYGPARATNEERHAVLENYKTFLSSIDSQEAMY
ncbi:MAG: NAD(P)H-dependent oxidoreductase [Bacteroidia bacterium]